MEVGASNIPSAVLDTQLSDLSSIGSPSPNSQILTAPLPLTQEVLFCKRPDCDSHFSYVVDDYGSYLAHIRKVHKNVRRQEDFVDIPDKKIVFCSTCDLCFLRNHQCPRSPGYASSHAGSNGISSNSNQNYNFGTAGANIPSLHPTPQVEDIVVPDIDADPLIVGTNVGNIVAAADIIDIAPPIHNNFCIKKHKEIIFFPASVRAEADAAFDVILDHMEFCQSNNPLSSNSSESVIAFLQFPNCFIVSEPMGKTKAAGRYREVATAPNPAKSLLNIVDNIFRDERSNINPVQQFPITEVSNHESERVIKDIRANQPGHALKRLESKAKGESSIKVSKDSVHFDTLKSLHPQRNDLNHKMPNMDLYNVAPGQSRLNITIDELLQHIKGLPRHKSSAYSAWTFELMKYFICKSPQTTARVLRLLNRLYHGQGGSQDIWLASRLIPIAKASGGIRPINVQDPWIRLLSSLLAAKVKEAAGLLFAPTQVGIGVSSGAEYMIHATKSSIDHALYVENSRRVTMKLDFKNAFNEIYQRNIYDRLLISFPHLASWFFWCYSRCTPIYNNSGEFLFNSEVGVKQGDALGPLYFSCGTFDSIQDVVRRFPDVDIMSYHDDVVVMGDVDSMASVASAIASKFLKIGLKINKAKCQIFCNAVCKNKYDTTVSFLNQIPISTDSFEVLGCPMGKNDSVELALSNKLSDYAKILPIILQLKAKSAFVLLRCCINARPTYLLRASYPWLTKDPIISFDLLIDKAIKVICSKIKDSVAYNGIRSLNDLNLLTGIPRESSIARSMAIRDGGAGIKRGQDIFEAAWCASWLKSWKWLSSKLINLIPILQSASTTITPFIVQALSKLELDYQDHKLDNLATIISYLGVTTENSPSQKAITTAISDVQLVEDLNSTLIESGKETALAWHISNKPTNSSNPTESAFVFVFPFKNQSLLEISDDFFVEVLRLRIFITISMDDYGVEKSYICGCGRVLHSNKDEYHFLICKAAGAKGPCAMRIWRHDFIRDRLADLMRIIHPDKGIRTEENVNRPSLNGKHLDSDVSIRGFGEMGQFHFDVAITSPSSEPAVRNLHTDSVARAAAFSMEIKKIALYRRVYGDAFIHHAFLAIVFEACGSFGDCLRRFLNQLKLAASLLTDTVQKSKKLNAIWWFKGTSAVSIASHMAQLVQFHRDNRVERAEDNNLVFVPETIPYFYSNDDTDSPFIANRNGDIVATVEEVEDVEELLGVADGVVEVEMANMGEALMDIGDMNELDQVFGMGGNNGAHATGGAAGSIVIVPEDFVELGSPDDVE